MTSSCMWSSRRDVWLNLTSVCATVTSHCLATTLHVCVELVGSSSSFECKPYSPQVHVPNCFRFFAPIQTVTNVRLLTSGSEFDSPESPGTLTTDLGDPSIDSKRVNNLSVLLSRTFTQHGRRRARGRCGAFAEQRLLGLLSQGA